ARPEASPPASAAAAPAGFTKEVSFAILQDYAKGRDLRDVERDFELMREIGVRTWRGSVGWDDYEPEPDHYDFDWLHRFAELAVRHGIELRPYIGRTPAWASAGGSDDQAWNDPPASLDEWADFVRRLVSAMRRHPNVRSWEIYSEENVRLGWDGTAEQYADVLSRAARAVRAADPDAELLLGGLAWPDAKWVERACSGVRVDVVPFHAYPETRTRDSVDVERYLGGEYRDDFLPAVRAHCGDRPIWINEIGFATVGEQSERDQANWWARAFATFLADPHIRHLGIRELGDSPLGLTRRDRRPKLAFHTVDLLTDLLDVGQLTVADAELGVRVTAGRAAALYHHLFVSPRGRQVLIVWDKRGSPALDITLLRRGSRVTEYTLDGRPVPFPQFDGRTLRRVRLSPGHVRIFDIAPEGSDDPGPSDARRSGVRDSSASDRGGGA
ncbi:MAG: beta-galactosidase, partial [Gemmatimonadales bacterium]